jgi:hypothetical protein
MCSDRNKNKTWYRSEKTYYTTDNFFGVGYKCLCSYHNPIYSRIYLKWVMGDCVLNENFLVDFKSVFQQAQISFFVIAWGIYLYHKFAKSIRIHAKSHFILCIDRSEITQKCSQSKHIWKMCVLVCWIVKLLHNKLVKINIIAVP